MQIPIISGIYTDNNSDVRTSYPKNVVPVPKKQGVSNGYLRPADGILKIGNGQGADRGGINWKDRCYRVSGESLIEVFANGDTNVLGEIIGSGQASFDYSFDRLAICADNRLYYWDGSALTQVTDPDLGVALDVIWVDGYFMTTDGENIVVTELLDPAQVDPLKYGSSEADPDDVKAIIKIRNEPYVLNRYSIEVFDNVGGSGFPFQRIEGAQMQKGAIGTHACCKYMDAVAFLGGGRNEPCSVWLGLNGQTQKISTREIDQEILNYTEDQLSSVLFESKMDSGLEQLYIHLPDKTYVYDGRVSQEVGNSVWYRLDSSLSDGEYLARNMVWCHDKWIVGHPSSDLIGYLSKNVSNHWGQKVSWEFSTDIIYNEGNSALMHEIELVPMNGRAVFGDDSTVWTDYSLDGVEFSLKKGIKTGARGMRNNRLVWYKQGAIRHWRIQRFSGTSDAHMSFLRLEVQVEPLLF